MPPNRVRPRSSTRSGRKKSTTQTILSQCTKLVVVDDQPIRQKVWRQYQSALKRHEKNTGELQQFKDFDLEHYRVWYEREFSGEIMSLQKSRMAVAELADWMEQIHAYANHREIALTSSFEILTAAKTENRLDQLWKAVAHEIEETEQKSKSQTKGKKEDFWPEFEDDFDSVFDEAARDFYQEPRQRAEPFGWTRQPQRDESAERSLRSLYHELALKLHPDTNPDQGQGERYLFQAAKEAYQAQDLEALEEVWKKLEGKSEGPFAWKAAPIGEIIHRKKSLDRRNRDIASDLKFARQHPAWNFSRVVQNKSLLSVLKQKTRGILQYEQLEIDAEWFELNKLLNQLEKSLKKKSKSRTSKVKRKT
ncbi:MAG: hypothetical protein M3Q07_07255 [Pseudobdellovibrionaceae bacterium]|nr:hypothetical protein [Pseudobdellovibrionaceae bacterium]